MTVFRLAHGLLQLPHPMEWLSEGDYSELQLFKTVHHILESQGKGFGRSIHGSRQVRPCLTDFNCPVSPDHQLLVACSGWNAWFVWVWGHRFGDAPLEAFGRPGLRA